MERTAEIKMLLEDAAEKLTGSDRRTFVAKVVNTSGHRGQRRAERELDWDRTTHPQRHPRTSPWLRMPGCLPPSPMSIGRL